MQTFKVQRWDQVTGPADPSRISHSGSGFLAPGLIVLLVQEGVGWVANQDGSRQALDAKSVVTYKTGDWVQYGSDSRDEFKIEVYSAADLP